MSLRRAPRALGPDGGFTGPDGAEGGGGGPGGGGGGGGILLYFLVFNNDLSI